MESSSSRFTGRKKMAVRKKGGLERREKKGVQGGGMASVDIECCMVTN